jgi:hypothetical protein
MATGTTSVKVSHGAEEERSTTSTTLVKVIERGGLTRTRRDWSQRR